MLVEILLFLAVPFLYFFVLFKVRCQYWQKKGVKTPYVSHWPMGNHPSIALENVLGLKNPVYSVKEQYDKFKNERYYGTYGPNGIPILMVNDPEIIKHILVRDFNHFVNRNSALEFFEGTSHTDEMWKNQMTNIKGDDWKEVRSTFSPIFTSGKMKMMMEFIHKVSQDMTGEVGHFAEHGQDIDLKALLGKYSMDTIASCAFGVNAGSFSDKESQFVKHARNTFRRTVSDGIKFVGLMIPGIKQLMLAARIPIFKPEETEFFAHIVSKTLHHRMDTKTRRNDLIDLMVDAIKHEIKDDNEDLEQFEADSKLNYKAKKKELEELTVVATSMVMLVAGYDTTAMTMSYMAWELAKKPEIQKRLQEEVDDIRDKCTEDGMPDYNAIQGMEYMDMIIHEVLRLHSPVSLTTRGCTLDYKIPGSDLTVKKGDEVHIPIKGIHMDERYYPNPEEFNPEHFSKEAKAKRSPYAFLGFGQGPRSCIGMRFALLEAKVGMFAILSKYNLVRCANTPETITVDPKSMLSNPLEPLWVRAEMRKG